MNDSDEHWMMVSAECSYYLFNILDTVYPFLMDENTPEGGAPGALQFASDRFLESLESRCQSAINALDRTNGSSELIDLQWLLWQRITELLKVPRKALKIRNPDLAGQSLLYAYAVSTLLMWQLRRNGYSFGDDIDGMAAGALQVVSVRSRVKSNWIDGRLRALRETGDWLIGVNAAFHAKPWWARILPRFHAKPKPTSTTQSRDNVAS